MGVLSLSYGSCKLGSIINQLKTLNVTIRYVIELIDYDKEKRRKYRFFGQMGEIGRT
jgi:hypothetical protein